MEVYGFHDAGTVNTPGGRLTLENSLFMGMADPLVGERGPLLVSARRTDKKP